MNIRTIGVIFVATVLILLIFQSVWLYNTYQLERGRVQSDVNAYFKESVKNELIIRLKKMDEEHRNIFFDANPETPEDDKIETTVFEIKVEESYGDVLQQYMLSFQGIKIDLSVLDSLFLQKSQYQLDHLISYSDSTNQIMEFVGNPLLERSNGVFVSDSIPIVNKSYVRLHADISVSVVLKQMIGLTIASFLMLLVLLVSLVVQIRYAYNLYRLNILREDFSQALIHDLKSPLNTIYISLSNYKNGLFEKSPDFAAKSTAMAIDQVLNIQALVDRILTIARLEDKKMEVSRAEVNLPLLIKKLTERYSFSTRKEVLFTTTFALDSTPVYADSILLENAIGNLIENAIKYSGESVTIHVGCEVLDKKLHLRVEDNGLGISEADQLKIFNKFERGAAVYRKGAKGFGLGLSYVRQVAIAHQGTVALSSVKGRGSEFVLVIPLLLESIDRDNPESNKKGIA